MECPKFMNGLDEMPLPVCLRRSTGHEADHKRDAIERGEKLKLDEKRRMAMGGASLNYKIVRVCCDILLQHIFC